MVVVQALGPGEEGGRGVREAFAWPSALERAGVSPQRRKREACARDKEQVTGRLAETLGALDGGGVRSDEGSVCLGLGWGPVGDVVVGDEAETQAHTRLGTTQSVCGCGNEITPSCFPLRAIAF